MKKLTVLFMTLLLVACGSIEIKESAGDEERFSRRPANEEKVIYSEVNLEEGVEPLYKEQFVPQYDYKPETKSDDFMLENLNK
ncbi:hypothetical protein [Ilyobacter polytropus]|uniref:Lipoprotein n=1 Tax=Ilyobacter polytropus (strain ATCC 51220 / DSM 2926 / LMG 16218 / CuHBu1) TaxID=572544 RepID=E3H8Y7_ILYPC|nr:hypothetical protein [Ilyobacter polytropus]ADO83541.1 hypothetical protein Ilyop_1770 [Ilyobacter polytropus DSM 2926]